MSGRAMELVSRAHLGWKRRVARDLAPFGVSPKQAFVLRKLAEADGLSPSRIAELVHADRPTVTSFLHTLERNEWIARRRNPADRREVDVRLTPAGRRKLASLPDELWRSGRTRFDPEACLTGKERAELVRILTKLCDWIENSSAGEA